MTQPLFWTVALVSSSFLVAAVNPVAAQQTLSIVNNGGAVGEASRKAWYETFAAAKNVRIVEDNWNQEYAKLRSQIETGVLKWDVVEITYNNMTLACDEGFLEKVDWSKHLNVKDFDAAGGVTDCAVPIMSVVGALAYDADKIKDAPKTWADFWNLQRWPGKRGLLYRVNALEIALLADGVPPAKVIDVLSAPGGVDRAFRKLDQIKPAIHWWKSGAESTQILATGEVVMTYAWNGRIAVANQKDKRNFKLAFDGGFILSNQYLAVMKGTKQKNAAVEFIAYAASAKPLARFAEMTMYGPPSRAAMKEVSSKLLETVPHDKMDKAYTQNGDKYRQYWLENLEGLTQRLAKWAAQ